MLLSLAVILWRSAKLRWMSAGLRLQPPLDGDDVSRRATALVFTAFGGWRRALPRMPQRTGDRRRIPIASGVDVGPQKEIG